MAPISRRKVLSGAGAAGITAITGVRSTRAQESTPAAVGAEEPGYALARVRSLPDEFLANAIYPDVMANFLPPTSAEPGFKGYVFAFDGDDPATSITYTTMADESSAQSASQVAQDYVDHLDPRFAVETPMSEEGQMRMYAVTSRDTNELPPFLHGTMFTMRNQTSAPGVDIENAIAIAQETLIPLFLDQPGFVLYSWIERPGGRIAVNIWETAEHLANASEALGRWRMEYFATPTASETTEFNGTIGYSTGIVST